MKTKFHHYSPRPRLFLAGFALALLAGLGSVTSRAEDTTTSDSKTPHGTRHFIMKAAMASNNEVALSQLAADHAASADVKSFAQDMITAHQQLNNDLQALATQKNVDITKAVAKGQKEDVESLSKKSGADFDKAYLKHMVKGHEEAASLFKKEANEGKDADVQALAAKYLPVINQHLEHAKLLKKSVEM